MLDITAIRIRKVNAGKLLALASVTLGGEFVVHDFKIFNGSNGTFVSMPSVKTIEGEYRDTAHPISKAFRESITNKILDEFAIV